MKHLSIIIVLLFVLGCKKDPKSEIITPQTEIKNTIEDTSIVTDYKSPDLESNKSIAIEIKQKALINKKDERQSLEQLITEKQFLKEKEEYTINFTYPELNETINNKYENFNTYISEYFLDISGTEEAILASKQSCDSIALKNFRETRLINYKIYNLNNDLLSIVFYKENFYNGTLHPSYSFNCLNFNLNNGVFMDYDDFFITNSETELTSLINEEISSKINEGQLYYDCWELSLDDFINYKNNFVLNETYIEYYLDDCIMCPSYTGSYSVKIPLVKLQSVLKKHDSNPLFF